jgi:hypothetical protein
LVDVPKNSRFKEVAMKPSLLALFLSGLLAIPLAVVAQDEEKLSCDAVLSLLASGSSAAEVVRATVATGMGLAEATVHAIECGGDENQETIARAGIEMAGNLPQAQSVADAVLASVGQTGPVADAVQVALQDYIRYMPQPDVYEDKYTPTGGDNAVSPAA